MNEQITLLEGIEQFRSKNMKYFSKNSSSEEGALFLECHDAAHVIFGCDTTLYGEGIVKVWTTFGTTLNFLEVTKGYNKANALGLSRKFSFRHVMKNILKLLLAIPKTIIRANRMSKPWPFLKYQLYLNSSLFEIRKEFNIQISDNPPL